MQDWSITLKDHGPICSCSHLRDKAQSGWRAGYLLGLFERNLKNGDPIRLTCKQIEQSLDGILQDQRLRRTLAAFVKRHLLLSTKLTNEEIVNTCKARTCFASFDADLICDWCESATLLLHNHHFPVPKSKGGTETVKICPQCHSEFHFLEKLTFYQPTQEFLDWLTSYHTKVCTGYTQSIPVNLSNQFQGILNVNS